MNTGSHYSASDVDSAAEGCGALAEYGSKNKIHVICENHGGPSSDPDALLALIKKVGNPDFGTLPDFGNFPNKDHKYSIDVYEAIARMMPYAHGVSAKSYDFDDRRQGEVPRLRPHPQDRHRLRLPRLGRHRVRGQPALRARGDQGDEEAPGVAQGGGIQGLRTR